MLMNISYAKKSLIIYYSINGIYFAVNGRDASSTPFSAGVNKPPGPGFPGGSCIGMRSTFEKVS